MTDNKLVKIPPEQIWLMNNGDQMHLCRKAKGFSENLKRLKLESPI